MRKFKVTKSFMYVYEGQYDLEITCFVKGGFIFLNDTDPGLEYYFVVLFDKYRPKQIKANKDCLEEVPYISEDECNFWNRDNTMYSDFVVHKRIKKA